MIQLFSLSESGTCNYGWAGWLSAAAETCYIWDSASYMIKCGENGDTALRYWYSDTSCTTVSKIQNITNDTGSWQCDSSSDDCTLYTITIETYDSNDDDDDCSNNASSTYQVTATSDAICVFDDDTNAGSTHYSYSSESITLKFYHCDGPDAVCKDSCLTSSGNITYNVGCSDNTLVSIQVINDDYNQEELEVSNKLNFVKPMSDNKNTSNNLISLPISAFYCDIVIAITMLTTAVLVLIFGCPDCCCSCCSFWCNRVRGKQSGYQEIV